MSERAPARDEALERLKDRLEDAVAESARVWWRESLEAVERKGRSELLARFPALRRRLGAEPLVEPSDEGRFLRCTDFVIDLAALRRADAGGMLLFEGFYREGGDASVLKELFAHGDVDERVASMRCLPLLRDASLITALAGEAQRSNTQDVVEAAYCDHDACARHLPEAEFNRLVLKLAFADLPFWRVLRGHHRANPELSRMLLAFATEREAAGRVIWADTLLLIALAPVEGTVPRLLDHLEHAREELREAAAEGVGLLGRPDLAPHLAARLREETHPPVRAALERALRRLT